MISICQKLRLLAAAGSAFLICAILVNPAKADIIWSVDGTFQDGGTVSGTFTINVYGYVSGYDLTTTAAGLFNGFHYLPSNSYLNNGALYVDFEPGYFGALHLT